MRFSALLIGLLLSLDSFAAVILSPSDFTFSPAAPTVTTGDSLTVDFNIAGLTSAPDDSISNFDVDISFDDTLLDFEAALSASDPNDEVDTTGNGFNSISSPSPGVINALTVSGNPTATDTNQSDAFTLAQLEFSAIDSGTAKFDFAFTTLRDTNNESVQIIPEPGTWLGAALAGVGLMGLIGWRRAQRLG